MTEDVLIYVDNIRGKDNKPGTQDNPVETADEAFRRLPSAWHRRAEIIFAVTDRNYPIVSNAIYLGTPVGPDASSLVIRGGYADQFRVTSTGGTCDEVAVASRADITADSLVGKVLTRLSPADRSVGPAMLIRGNSDGSASSGWSIMLQRSLDRPVESGEDFSIQQPAVTLVPDSPPHPPTLPEPGQALNLTSHDGRSPNLTIVGIRIAPSEGRGLNLLNVRAQCDTCEFAFRRTSGAEALPTTFYIHTDSRIQGGIEGDIERAQAGAYIQSDHTANSVWAVRAGILGGHLTFKTISVRVSQGGWFIPKSLEALRSPIQIMTGGSALAEPQKEAGIVVGGWGTPTNKGRIRNAVGDGLSIIGGSLNSPAAPIHLDVSACTGNGIRLDIGSAASFGAPGGLTGLITMGADNGKFGMNIRNGSHALVGSDTDLHGANHRDTVVNDVALDDVALSGWSNVAADSPPVGRRLSSVRRNS